MRHFLKRLAQGTGILVLVLVLLLWSVRWYQPKLHPVVLPEPKPVSGAAVFYNQAFAAIPELSDEEKKVIHSRNPDSAAAWAILDKWDVCLGLARKAAAVAECEWGLDYTIGPGVETPMATKTLRICQILAMRAQLHFGNKDAGSAVEDFMLIFHISRHVGREPFSIFKLVEISEQITAMSGITQHLQQIDAASLRKLNDQLAMLQPVLPIKKAVTEEIALWSAWFNNMIVNQLLDSKKPHEQRGGGDKKRSFQFDTSDQEYTVTGGIALKYLVYSLKCNERHSRELMVLMERPFPEVRPKLDAFEKEMEAHRWRFGPFAIGFAPLSMMVFKEAQISTIWKAFRLALDTQMRDPSAVRSELAKLRDPYDGQPIELCDVEGGVKIRLKSAEGKKPVTLFVQLPKK